MSCLQAATPAEPQLGGATAAAKALSEMAVRLVTGLAAGATAPTFRAAVAELPPVLKQRLQVIMAIDGVLLCHACHADRSQHAAIELCCDCCLDLVQLAGSCAPAWQFDPANGTHQSFEMLHCPQTVRSSAAMPCGYAVGPGQSCRVCTCSRHSKRRRPAERRAALQDLPRSPRLH